MKKFLLILLILLIVFLTSCAKLTREEYVDVEAVITDTYYKPPCTLLMPCGKTLMPITQPAVYRVTVKYEGIEYNISGRSFYEEHKDKVGKSIKVVCHKRYYDDGNIKQDIEAPDNHK